MREILRTLKWSVWLGWQVESNWANPWLFALYLVVKPITGSLMLVAMFYAADAATAGRVPAAMLPFAYISNACFGLVGGVMFGMASVVTSDRDGYRMLKYIFISPARFQVYFLGRGIAKMLESLAGAAITITAGLALPGVRSQLGIEHLDIPWMLAYLAIGFVMLWAGGMILASIVLLLSRSASFLSEGIAGVVFFLSGVLFPLTILPEWLQAIGRCLPTTYWMEGLRRTLLGPPKAMMLPNGHVIEPMFADWSNVDIMGMLLATSLGLVAVSQWLYRRNLAKAWRRGKIEETQGM